LDAAGILLKRASSSLVKYIKDEAERRLVVYSAYVPYDSEDVSPSRGLEELVRYCENENLFLIVGCESVANHANCNGSGEALMQFFNSSNLKIFNWGNESTFCSGLRQEMIDITLGFYRLLQSSTG
jgi:hypothetical protein